MPEKAGLETENDTKTSRPIREVVRRFKYQPRPSSCYPNAIHNVLKELAERHDAGIAFSERRINQITRYDQFLGPKLEVVVPELNRVLKSRGYMAAQKASATFKHLVDVSKDLECSYPIAGVSSEYFKRVAPRYKTRGNPRDDHVLIVLKVDEEELISWDAYHHFLGASARVEGMRGLVALKTGEFLELWETAYEPSWMFWICRERTQMARLKDFET